MTAEMWMAHRWPNTQQEKDEEGIVTPLQLCGYCVSVDGGECLARTAARVNGLLPAHSRPSQLCQHNFPTNSRYDTIV